MYMNKIYRRAKRALDKSHRLLIAEQRAMPDFIIIGAQKAGTTSFYRYLMQHPQVMEAAGKEVHFFDYRFRRGVRWYKAHFPRAAEIDRLRETLRKPVITGEASPYYLFHPHAPRRMAELIPGVKLIVLLRNPVDRARSHYYHEIRKRTETLSFEQAIDGEAARLNGEAAKMLASESYYSFNHHHFAYLSRGIYIDQLKTYEKYFNRDQMLILNSEEFFSNTQAVYDRAITFLGLERSSLGDVQPCNCGSYVKRRSVVESRLEEYFFPHNERLYEHLGIGLGW